MHKLLTIRYFIIIALIMMQISTTNAHSKITHFEPKVVSDSSINDFLRTFIANSMANVEMLVKFVTQMLRDAIGSRQEFIPNDEPANNNKIIIQT